MDTLIVDRRDGVVTVTMNRPERKNAIDRAMLQALGDVLVEVEVRRDDRVLVLGGAGGAFCSGADLGDPEGMTGDPDAPALVSMRRLGDVALALHRLSKPTIAKVDGVAVGAGLSLAVGCDLVVASERARFSAIFARRGLSLDFGASWLLPRLIGLARAKEVALFADIFDAARADALGLVNRVVPVDELDGFAADWARRLAAGPPLALSMTKTLLNDALSSSMAEALEDEARCQAVNFGSRDTAEAMAAFVEKREPRFSGR
ncbi:MAG TPA: enoyl-CoA hydratase [Acidimicrobiales bacterium]|nr:enoyl-CoA hydratase [Acidimicrobiales bacterium]